MPQWGRCGNCNETFYNTLELGRHVRWRHRSGAASAGGAAVPNAESVVVHPGEIEQEEVLEHDLMPGLSDSPDIDGLLPSHNISNEIYKFYKSFRDESEPGFKTTETLVPSLPELCPEAKVLLNFCCTRVYIQKEIGEHFELHKNLTAAMGCASQSALATQFSGKNQFVDYVRKVRRHFVPLCTMACCKN